MIRTTPTEIDAVDQIAERIAALNESEKDQRSREDALSVLRRRFPFPLNENTPVDDGFVSFL